MKKTIGYKEMIFQVCLSIFIMGHLSCLYCITFLVGFGVWILIFLLFILAYSMFIMACMLTQQLKHIFIWCEFMNHERNRLNKPSKRRRSR